MHNCNFDNLKASEQRSAHTVYKRLNLQGCRDAERQSCSGFTYIYISKSLWPSDSGDPDQTGNSMN